MIEIPGYRILRQLGRGGMATVYLAIQQSVDREVALKIMSPQLLADPNFGERFLREARIAAKLHHRHVVGVHDVGKHGDTHYIAMEYLAGGPILRKDGQPRDVVFALRVVREIATALAYAHAKGFVHRDIKPDNILLRDDGSSALTDFGIARASDSATRMTRTGAVIGTPHYMSPEQARGRTIDGRADLYSLGVVLYELLVGRVPFHAEDSLAVGIMHITEPPPVLPEALSALQPMLDVLLAKKPEERYQTGEEMANAIREYEVAIARGELPSLVLPSRAEADAIMANVPTRIETPRVAAPAAREPASPPTRQEPSLGDTSYVDTADRRHHRYAGAASAAARESVRRRFPWGALFVTVLLAAGGAAAWYYQDRLRALVPSTELNTLLADADRARAAGRLAGAEPDSALALYRAVLALDPDNTQALAGVRAVGEALAADAGAALDAGDIERARTRLEEARAILQGGAAIDAVQQRLTARDSEADQVKALLAEAIAAQQAGKLTGAGSAAELFQRVLTADPGSGIATRGLDEIAATLAGQARTALAAKDYAAAEAALAQIEAVQPSNAAATELRAALADQRTRDRAELSQWLDRGEAQLRAGALTTPSGANARASFEAALALDPTNARARAGLSRIGAALVVQANAAIDAGDAAAADRLLRDAERLGAPAGELRGARTALRELRERTAIAQETRALTPEQQAKLDDFLTRADAALAAGQLVEPPGDNAYDLYRAAMSIDRNNARAKAGVAAIGPRAQALFAEAIAAGRPNTARSHFDAFNDASRDDAAKAAMRGQLVAAYLAQGERQLGAGQREQAARSLARARELAPSDPAVAAFAAKLGPG